MFSELEEDDDDEVVEWSVDLADEAVVTAAVAVGGEVVVRLSVLESLTCRLILTLVFALTVSFCNCLLRRSVWGWER